ncbi:FecCD family ABC transporter permease [Lysinibacillus sp. NPDC093712]|uniref:FecCD family ABC transporter permease n=1 Tax=Lysinibacillus sp. NPDC093712 TaxID=3390579 RepID=UPI003CFE6AD4
MMVNSKRSFSALLLLLIGLVFVSMIVSASIGQVSIPFLDSCKILLYQFTGINMGHVDTVISNMTFEIVWQIRTPRILLALIVGAGLALCGSVMQASIQNPLADPYILGISSGASLGATFSIILGHRFSGFFGEFDLIVWAFLGALIATFLVLLLSSVGEKMSVIKLILAGTVVNALFTALSNLFIYFAKDAEGVRSVSFWTMGSLASADWNDLPLIAVIVTIVGIFFLSQWRVMNAMLMGDDAAMSLGINLNIYRRVYLVITAILTGVIVSICGIIGFVGLIIPHIVRIFTGSNHRYLVPTVILVGAIFLTWTDLLARTIIPNSELPIGIVTSLLGAPVFMHMLIKKKYGFGGN